MLENLLDLSGIGRGRIQLRWVSAAEGQIFANYITELTADLAQLGPFDASKFSIELSAVERVLNSSRVRWLSGMDRQITERENVYHEKLDEAAYEQLLQSICKTEYQKALILESLGSGPQSVREISAKSGLAVQTVSERLTDVEKAGAVELHGYEGSTPRFSRLLNTL